MCCWGRFVPFQPGTHTFLTHFKHIKKPPKRCHFLSKESYKRECEMALFSQAKWNTVMFYSCKVKTPFLCSITNWICSCKLLLRKKRIKGKGKLNICTRNTKAPSCRARKLRGPMGRNRNLKRQTCFFIYYSRWHLARTPTSNHRHIWRAWPCRGRHRCNAK